MSQPTQQTSRPSGIEEKAVNSRDVSGSVQEHTVVYDYEWVPIQDWAPTKVDDSVVTVVDYRLDRYISPPSVEEDNEWKKKVMRQTALAIQGKKGMGCKIRVKNSFAPLDDQYYQKACAVRSSSDATPMYRCPVTPQKRRKRAKKVKIVNRVRGKNGKLEEFYTVLPTKVNTAVVEEYSKKLEKVVLVQKERTRDIEHRAKVDSKYAHLRAFVQSHDEWEQEMNEAPWTQEKIPLSMGLSRDQKEDMQEWVDGVSIRPQSGIEETVGLLLSGACMHPNVAKPVLKQVERLVTTLTLMCGAKSWPYALLQVYQYLSTTLGYTVAEEAYQAILDIWDNSKQSHFEEMAARSVDPWQEASERIDHLASGKVRYASQANEKEARKVIINHLMKQVDAQMSAYADLERSPGYGAPDEVFQRQASCNSWSDRNHVVGGIQVQGAQELLSKMKGASFVGCMDAFKMCFKDFQAVANSEFVKRLKKMVAYVVALGLCQVEKIPLTHIKFEEYYKTSGIADLHWSEIWTGIIDTVLYVYDIGLALFKGESYMDVIGTARGATNFEVKYAQVVGNISLYEDDKLELVKMTMQQYERWLDQLEEQIKGLHSRLSGPEKNIAAIKMRELAKIRVRVVTAQHSMPMREAPFTFYLFGGPGVGKSVVLAPLLKFVMEVNGYEYLEEDIAHLRLDEAYQSELTSRNVAIVVDDIGNTLVNLEKGSTGQALIDYNNNIPRHALRADLESKGKVLIKPKFFALTGNTADVQAHMRSNEPLSLARRLGVRITQSVKPEWMSPDSNMIDPSKMTDLVEDAWHFTVEKPVPLSDPIKNPGATEYQWRVQEFEGKKLRAINMETLLRYMAVISKEHFKHQRRLMKNAQELKDLKLCEHEMYPSVCSKCKAEEQGHEQVETQSGRDVYSVMKNTREWCYKMTEIVPDCIKENKVVNHVYTRLDALGRLENGVNGMKVFSAIGGSIGMMTASLFSATTPVVVFMGLFLGMASYATLAVMKTHRALKKMSHVTFVTLQPLVAGKYKYAWGGAIGAAGVIAATMIALRLFRPHAKQYGDSVIKEVLSATPCNRCGKTCGCEDAEQEEDDGLYIGPKPQVGFVPKPDPVSRENVYVPVVIEPIKARHRIETTTHEQMLNVVKRSLAFARFHVKGDNVYSVCDLFPYKSNVWIAPYHILKRGCDKIEVIRHKPGLNNNRECLITEGCWKRVGTSDLCLVSLSTVGEVLDTSEFYLEGEFPREQQAVKWVYKTREADIVEDAFVARFSMVEVKMKDGEVLTYPGWYYEMNMQTQEGFCMAVILSRGTRPHILGFHSAGDSSNCQGRGHYVEAKQMAETFACLMSRKIGDSQNINVQVASQGDMVLDYPKYGIKSLGVMNEKSPFMFQSEPGHVELYGAHTGGTTRYKSQVCPTFISEAVKEYCGVERMHGPPKAMNSWKPWRADVEAVLPCKQLDPAILGKAFADLEKHYVALFESMSQDQKDNIRPLGITANLSGVDGVFGIDRVKLNTSTGPPICKPKSTVIHPLDDKVEGISCPLRIDAEFEENMREIEDTLAQGYRVYCKFKTSLKDEPTKLTKDKVRTFSGAQLELLLEVRKYFLPLAKVIMDNPEYFSSAVGINAHSAEWTRLAKFLTKFGTKRSIAGDYGLFDSRMINQLVLLAFTLLISCASVLGWSQRELAIMRGLATEVAHGLCDYNGEYVLWHGQNLSGQAMTVFINNIVNKLYIGFAYYMAFHMLKNPNSDWNVKFDEYLGTLREFETMEQVAAYVEKWRSEYFYLKDEMRTRDEPPSPQETLAVICYGDDNNMSVSEECTWFNHTSMAGILQMFGVKYTMADKNAPSVPFVDFHDTTFLKRGFVWNERLQNYMAPLEIMSIYKTLHSCRRSRILTPEEQAAEALLSVNRELFFHGKEVFEEWRPKLQKVVEATQLGSYLRKGGLPDYQYYESEYIVKNGVTIKPELSGVVVENSSQHLDTHVSCLDTVQQDIKAFGGLTQIAVQSSYERILLFSNNPGEERREERVTNTYEVGTGMMVRKDETITFRDGVEQWETAIKNGWDDTRDVAMLDAPSFQEFFARPVIYNLGTWVPGSATPIGFSFDPWQVFFEDKRVVNRLSNFNLTQATLKVKFLINGNAFYYGRLMVDYVPLQVYNTVDSLSTANKNCLIQASQRLKLFLNPTTSQGGVMSLPFLWYKNSVNLVSGEIEAMGQIFVREINGLKHANAGTDVVTLQAYIWSEDLRLSVPTTQDAYNINPQSGDEYGDSPVSAMATAAAKIAGRLEATPGIGRYAKATSMAMGGLGQIAKAFGFSRPTLIEPPTNMRQHPLGLMANTNVPDSSTKLTVDAKQEVTIDPMVLGINVPDEMVIKEIASRESYITQFTWPISAARDSLLWNTAVLPTMSVVDNSFTNPMTWYPACGFAALPFKWWRGTMRYRFQIVCSEYHKGRLRFVYDPNWISGTDRNVVMSRIVDLTNERDFVMDISWGQATPFAQVDTGYAAFGTVAITAKVPTSNGTLAVFVENDLTSPNTTINNDIKINVFVSACDDFEVAVPVDSNIQNLTYSTQSGIEVQSSDEPALPTDNAPVKEDKDDEIMSCAKVDHTYDVLFGETVTSFRQLVKRYNFHSAVLLGATTAGKYSWLITDRDFPRYRGKWADAIDAPVTGTVNINNARNTMINYLTPAYVAYRGGLRWKYLYHTDNTNSTDYEWVFRSNDDTGNYVNINAAIDFTPANFSKVRAQSIPALGIGADLTYTRMQPALEVEVPYYLPYRFSLCKAIGTYGYTEPDQRTLSHTVRADATITANAYYDRFVAGAEDFSLYLFNGMPPVRSIDLNT